MQVEGRDESSSSSSSLDTPAFRSQQRKTRSKAIEEDPLTQSEAVKLMGSDFGTSFARGGREREKEEENKEERKIVAGKKVFFAAAKLFATRHQVTSAVLQSGFKYVTSQNIYFVVLSLFKLPQLLVGIASSHSKCSFLTNGSVG